MTAVSRKNQPKINQVGGWVIDQCRNVQTLIVLGGVIWTGINAHFARTGALDALVSEQVALRKDVDKNTDDIRKVNSRITKEMVSRQDYEHDTKQLDVELQNLATGQQQIYNLMILQSRPSLIPAPAVQYRSR